MGEKFTRQRTTKVAAGGFPDTVGCQRAIELTPHSPYLFLCFVNNSDKAKYFTR